MTDVWGLGDYARVAARLAPVAEVAVEAAGVSAGQRVADVAAGSGNVSLAAAHLGATVTASDLSPHMVALGQERTAGLDVTWQEADAEALPFEDGAFDCALSVFGAMFAPDQRAAARELLRIVRPGGGAVMTAWVPEGPQAEAMAVVSRQFPDRPQMMNDWGDPAVARAHFEAAGATDVHIERTHVHWEFAGYDDWRSFVEEGPGPMVAGRQALGEDRWADVRAEMATKVPTTGPFAIESPYLLITAR